MLLEVKVNDKVLYADTDAGGVAYFGSSTRWIERGYVTWFETYVLSLAKLTEQYNIFMFVKTLEINYQSPIYHNQSIKIVTSLKKILSASMVFNINILNSDDAECVRATCRLVCYSAEKNKVVELPQEIFSKLKGEEYA